MAIKVYSVSLDEDIVKNAKRKNFNEDGKLSPTINLLLRVWLTFPIEIKELMEKL